MADDDEIPGTDDERGPDKEPKSSKGWLILITKAQKVYQDYHDRCDGIEKRYASMERLANTARDREFQIFWANVQVLGPSIYSRPPVPVVVPRFKDRRPLHRVTSELLERTAIVLFEQEDVDSVMRLVRDDLTILARGAIWIRYEAKSKDNDFQERVCIEQVNRKDFLHDPARNWKEVDWAAKRSWLTRKEMRGRFRKASGDAYKDAAFEVRKDAQDNHDGRLKAGVWELWSRSENRVVWVTEGVDVLLDDDKPHLKLDGFFPCPRPAYGTVQRNSLIPVPDYLQYKDQIEEINELTARISSLTESLKLRGFYPAGAGEIGDAIEAAIKSTTNNQVLVPISNWAMFGGGAAKDAIVWLPLDQVVSAITSCVELRRQLIDDVYQITGLSDIMRGSTEASETLGAQELKSQYGSIRIRDRQDELIRMARDITRISAEIMAEEFQQKTLLDMSQLEVATDADIGKQVKALEQQVSGMIQQIREAAENPELQALAQQNPEQAEQIIQGAQQQVQQLGAQIEELKGKPTIEKVVKFLRDQRLRPFVLDIETDSTIAPDENATKQRATEFVTAVGGYMGQVMPLVQQVPQAAELAAETLKYVASQFRAGRQLEGVIEEFADRMKEVAAKPQTDPAQATAEAEAQAIQQKAELDQKEAAARQAEREAIAQAKQAETVARQQADERKAALEKVESDERLKGIQAENASKATEAQIRQQAATEARANAAQQHVQSMKKGVIELALLNKRIEQISAQTAAAAQNAQAKLDGDRLNG